MALATRPGPSTVPPLDTVMAPTAATSARGRSTELMTAVRLRSSSLVSAAARESTRRRALPREPSWGRDSYSMVEAVGVMSGPFTGRSGGGGHCTVSDGEEGLFEGGCAGLQAGQLETVLARPGQHLGER